MRNKPSDSPGKPTSPTLGELRRRRQTIEAIARRRGASNLRIFGSVARGEATLTSDVDLLVAWSPEHSLLDRIALMQELGDVLGVDVDVVTEQALHPALRGHVLSEAVPL